jgi:hypothetical protein
LELAFTFATGVPVRLAELNAYTTPEAGISVPGDGPPVRCNIPVTVPEGAADESPWALDDEQPEKPTTSRTSPNEVHAVCLLRLIIMALSAAP